MNQEKTLKDTAEEVISDIHKFEHEEKMRVFRLINNGLLIFFTFLFAAVVSGWFVLLLFIFWEWSGNELISDSNKDSIK